MVRFTGGLLLFAALSAAAPAERESSLGGAQQVLSKHHLQPPIGNPRKLRGKFLHITDVHPDPFYREGTEPGGDHPCHKGNGPGSAGYYGAPTTKCDAPFALVNATFKWIEENVKDEIDFVIWTGDSARHDNDEDHPRTSKQIQELNRYVVHKFVETFGKPDNINDTDPTNDFVVPIVPTYGNNDILPHNIFEPGPNRWTRDFIDIWSKFIPEAQIHSFARGGWYWSEVIPNRLAVISLNTLYFFDSNSAVDGCDLESEPGYEHMEWLRIQLQLLRERSMKAILIGHVPPARTESKQNWDESCYQKYTLWQRQYRDVIMANMFGHMNIDHFMFQDVRDLTYKFKIDGIDTEGLRPNMYTPHPASNDDFNAMGKATYLNELRDSWAALPTPPKGLTYASAADAERLGKRNSKEQRKFLHEIGGAYGERFSLTFVSPSVVPNFFPTLRIVEYNTSGLKHDHPAVGPPLGTPAIYEDLVQQRDIQENNDYDDDIHENDDVDTERKKKKKKKKNKGKKGKHPEKPSFPVPAPPSKSAPPGPAYSPQTLSLTSWTQLYVNISRLNDMHRTSQALSGSADDIDAEKKGNQEDKDFKFEVEYTTRHDKVYRMNDLTMRHWLDLAERIGRTEYAMSDKAVVTEEKELTDDTEIDENSGDFDSEKRKGKKKHKGKKDKSSGKLKKNRLWHVFIKRVFVGTMTDKDLEDDFD